MTLVEPAGGVPSRLVRRLIICCLAAMLLAATGPGLCLLAAEPSPEIVGLTVDYGDGVQKVFTALPWRQAMTVRDLMQLAQEHPRGIRFASRGSGATELLTRIDDLDNQGTRGRNWIFHVNGKLADRSLGAYRLRPGDAVLWEFGKYR